MLSALPHTPAIVDALLEHDFDPVAAAGSLGLCPTELIHWYRDPAAQQALADIETFQLQLARLQALKFRRIAAAELASLFTDAEATRAQRLRATIALLRPDRAHAPAPHPAREPVIAAPAASHAPTLTSSLSHGDPTPPPAEPAAPDPSPEPEPALATTPAATATTIEPTKFCAQHDEVERGSSPQRGGGLLPGAKRVFERSPRKASSTLLPHPGGVPVERGSHLAQSDQGLTISSAEINKAPDPTPAAEPLTHAASTTPRPAPLDPRADYLRRVSQLRRTGNPPRLPLTSHTDTQTPAACSPTQRGQSPPA